MERLTEWRGEHAAIVNNHANYIDRLAAYEDTGLTPEGVAALQTHPDHAYADYVKALWAGIGGMDKMEELAHEEEQGLLVRIDERFALAMLAGARAIEQNPMKYFGATLVHDVFGDNPKKISYHDAAKMLREEAEAALKEG